MVVSKGTYTRRAALAMLGTSGALAAASSAGYSTLTTKRTATLSVASASSTIKITDRNGNEPGDTGFGNYNPKANGGTAYLTVENNFSFDLSLGATNSNVTVSDSTVSANSSVDVTLTHSQSSSQSTELEVSEGSQSARPYSTFSVPAAPSSAAARWTLDTSSVLDAWGSNDGSVTEGTAGATGLAGYNSGTAFDFVGNDDGGVGVPYQPDFSTAQSHSFWINVDSTPTGWMGVYGRDNSGDNSRVFEYQVTPNDALRLYMKDESISLNANYTPTGGTLSPGTSHHVAVTYEGTSNGDLTLYVDGSNVASTTMPPQSGPVGAQQNQDFGIGARRLANNTDGTPKWAEDMDGQMDDVRFYNKELTASEVTSLYNTGAI